MITLHHLENSRSQRVLWLLESLKVDDQVKNYKRNAKTKLAPKSLLSIHSLGKSPVIEDDGVILAESGAIFQYLLNKYDTGHKLHPEGVDDSYNDYLFWLHFAEGSLAWPLVMRLLHQTVIDKTPFGISTVAKLIFTGIEKAYLTHTINNAFDYIEKTLEKGEFFLGKELSAVDMMMSFPLEAACSGRVKMENYPKILSFVKMIKKNADYQKVIELGGPYAY
jgi:glutathione S-transferase